jgi:hypothetical protein
MPEDKLAQHPEVRARVLADRGAVELWPGHLDEAARFLDAGVAAATGPGAEHERAACLGHLALVEALRGQLRHAAKLAGQSAAALADSSRRPHCPQVSSPASRYRRAAGPTGPRGTAVSWAATKSASLTRAACVGCLEMTQPSGRFHRCTCLCPRVVSAGSVRTAWDGCRFHTCRPV